MRKYMKTLSLLFLIGLVTIGFATAAYPTDPTKMVKKGDLKWNVENFAGTEEQLLDALETSCLAGDSITIESWKFKKSSFTGYVYCLGKRTGRSYYSTIWKGRINGDTGDFGFYIRSTHTSFSYGATFPHLVNVAPPPPEPVIDDTNAYRKEIDIKNDIQTFVGTDEELLEALEWSCANYLEIRDGYTHHSFEAKRLATSGSVEQPDKENITSVDCKANSGYSNPVRIFYFDYNHVTRESIKALGDYALLGLDAVLPNMAEYSG